MMMLPPLSSAVAPLGDAVLARIVRAQLAEGRPVRVVRWAGPPLAYYLSGRAPAGGSFLVRLVDDLTPCEPP